MPSAMPDESAPLHVSIHGQTAFLTLDRPKALNAIDLALADALDQTLTRCETDPAITRVVLAGSTPRAFCAGGDLRALHKRLMAEGPDATAGQFGRVYDLFARIAHFRIPVIAVMDGIAMGGGIGLGGHATHRIVTERSALAMPEVLIGLTPDAGGSWLLACAPGFAGLRLALTGGRMNGAQAVANGFADHLVDSPMLPALISALEHGKTVQEALLACENARPEAQTPEPEAVDAVYAAPDLTGVLDRLRNHSAAWAREDLAEIEGASPLALRVTFAAWHRVRALGADCAEGFDRALAWERTMIAGLLHHPDFAEGVRARVIDKDRAPKWQWASSDAVPDALVASILGAT